MRTARHPGRCSPIGAGPAPAVPGVEPSRPQRRSSGDAVSSQSLALRPKKRFSAARRPGSSHRRTQGWVSRSIAAGSSSPKRSLSSPCRGTASRDVLEKPRPRARCARGAVRRHHLLANRDRRPGVVALLPASTALAALSPSSSVTAVAGFLAPDRSPPRCSNRTRGAHRRSQLAATPAPRPPHAFDPRLAGSRSQHHPFMRWKASMVAARRRCRLCGGVEVIALREVLAGARVRLSALGRRHAASIASATGVSFEIPGLRRAWRSQRISRAGPCISVVTVIRRSLSSGPPPPAAGCPRGRSGGRYGSCARPRAGSRARAWSRQSAH